MSPPRHSFQSRFLSVAAVAAAPLLVAAQTYNPSAACTGGLFPVISNLTPGVALTIPQGVIGTAPGNQGTDTVTWAVDQDGGVTVTPNPAYSKSDNFWFFKFDTAECFDITNYNTAEFEYMAPPNSSFGWTMTVHQDVCAAAGAFGCYNNTFYCPRGPDTSYHFLNEYTKTGVTDGTWQKVSLPLYDFRINVADNATDFNHIKDWTFVGLDPVNRTDGLAPTFRWRNFNLNCRTDFPSIKNLPKTLTKTNPNPAGFVWDATSVDYTGAKVAATVATSGAAGASATSTATVGAGAGSASSTATRAASTTAAAATTAVVLSTATGKAGAAGRVGGSGSWGVAALVAGAAVVIGL
ncbi:hypothetical protein HDU93_009452 [Gonapodya sp. JEL0774]|nr:hypothetical protein HDU93_009452 [Gonapodya sp. JEL0774]